ncbi:MAG: tagaturonate reductase [Armatimonadaceae bacterium]
MNETILQFGAGNFLRAFYDVFVQEMNNAGKNVGKIVVVQSTDGDRARLLNESGGAYHIVVRGLENGQPVDRVQKVESISRALTAQSDWEAVQEFTKSPDLHTIVSNTTEAGLVLEDADRTWTPTDGVAPASFPARLLALLRTRWEADPNLPSPLMLPCELMDHNADLLRNLVSEQAERWQWQESGFTDWLANSCAWANTLVDRIASGKPAEHPLLDSDPLLCVTEPYQFFAVEDHPATAYLDHPAIHRVPDVQPYSLRKVRILNGTHTALVAYCRTHRPEIRLVREAVTDAEVGAWIRGLLWEEIVPTIADRVPDAEGFATQTMERFANPYLDHRLESIALHHETKVQVRLVPTLHEYREKFGKDPERLSSVLTGVVS